MIAIISGMCSVALGKCSTRSMCSVSRSRRKVLMNGSVYSASESPALCAPWMVLSSTSVRFITWVTR